MKLLHGTLAVLCLFGQPLAMGCVVADDQDDDGEGEETGPSTQGSESQGETQSAETEAMTSDPTDDTAETSDPEDTGDPPETTETGQSSESDDDSDSGGGLSPECDALCAHTPTALDAEADCVAATLNKLGGHNLQEPSCMAFETAFDEGTATVPMCEQCYLDAGIAAQNCTAAEEMCFFFP
jgi:hypothetical protein